MEMSFLECSPGKGVANEGEKWVTAPLRLSGLKSKLALQFVCDLSGRIAQPEEMLAVARTLFKVLGSD